MKTEDRTEHITEPAPAERSGHRRDLAAVGVGVVLVATAALVGRAIESADHSLFVHWPPLLASWNPHGGIGTVAAPAVAAAVIAHGPLLAVRLR
ncbi:hypothetical protein R6M67_42080, partial [Streptomyces sp. Wh19]|nr:hypothetical protein [Streptomyces sp. Wh19]